MWETTNEPFGSATETVKVVEQNLRFPGQYLDRETGLHYNYFRTYDPLTGRYVESDPIGVLYDYSSPKLTLIQLEVNNNLVKSDLSSLNHSYGYANQNPAVYFDENDLECSSKLRNACFGLFCVLTTFSSPAALGEFGKGQAGRPAPIEIHQIREVKRPRRPTGDLPNR